MFEDYESTIAAATAPAHFYGFWSRGLNECSRF